MNRMPLDVLVEGNDRTMELTKPGHQSGSYHVVRTLASRPNVYLVDNRLAMVPEYRGFETLLSIYKRYSSDLKMLQTIRQKEHFLFDGGMPFDTYRRFFDKEPDLRVSFRNIQTSLQSNDPTTIEHTLAFLKVLRNKFAEIMDKAVERFVLGTSRDIVYVAGTAHTQALRNALLRNGFTLVEDMKKSLDKDCVFINAD
jgi:hypothetical protein